MMGYWKKFCRRCWSRGCGFWIWLGVILFGSLAILYCISEGVPMDWMPEHVDSDQKWASKDSAEIFAYWLTGVAGALLVVVAYFKIGQLNKDDEARFFLQLDKRWTSEPIMQAKQIIKYLEVKNSDKNGLRKTNKIGAEVFDILYDGAVVSAAKMEEKARKATVLLNFLDFMESIGFLYVEQYVQFKNVDAACGESFSYYYEIFRDYIEKQRKLSKNIRLYSYFETLAEEARIRQEGQLYKEEDCNCG